jgi:hypothetical protein
VNSELKCCKALIRLRVPSFCSGGGVGILRGGEGLDMIGRAKMGGGGGPEAFGRGAAPARFYGKSKAKLPSIWPG